MVIETSDTHYTLDGKKFVRVTQILKSLGLVCYDNIPGVDKDWVLARGTENHRLWELMEKGEDGGYSFDPEVEKFREGHRKFLAETGFKSNDIELLVSNESLGVAGRIDRLGILNGAPIIIDLKTNKVHPATAIQTAIYALCLPGPFTSYKRAGVAIRNDGTYRITRFDSYSDRDDALAAIRTYRLKGRLNGNRDDAG